MKLKKKKTKKISKRVRNTLQSQTSTEQKASSLLRKIASRQEEDQEENTTIKKEVCMYEHTHTLSYFLFFLIFQIVFLNDPCCWQTLLKNTNIQWSW